MALPRPTRHTDDNAPAQRALRIRAKALIFWHEMRDSGHYLFGQEPHRLVPGLGVFAVVEAEQKNRPEPADLRVHPFDLLDHSRGGPDQPILPGAILRGDIAVGDVGVVLEELDDTE